MGKTTLVSTLNGNPNSCEDAADVDDSGAIDIIDALMVAQAYVGLIELPPYEKSNWKNQKIANKIFFFLLYKWL